MLVAGTDGASDQPVVIFVLSIACSRLGKEEEILQD